VEWNFTKFLIAGDGTPLRRYAAITRPEKIEGEIRKGLGK
jgi:glutathione peroxidase